MRSRNSFRALAAFSVVTFFGILTSAYADDVVKVGFSSPLTGPMSNFGKDMENGVKLALEEAKAQGVKVGGKAIDWELDSQDDQGDARIGVTVAQKMVDDNVKVVIGHFNSGVTIPASLVYEQANIALIDPSATNPIITSRGLKNVFAVISTDAQLSGAAGAYAVKVTKAQRIAILDDRTAFGQGQADEFEKAVKAAGGNVVAREYTTDKAVDFRTQLTTIKGTNADLLFYGGDDPQAGPLAKQMKALGMRTLLVAGGIVDSGFLDLAGSAAEGVQGWQYGVPLETSAKGREFAQTYKKRFGTDVFLYSPSAYDATWTAIKAMQAAGSTSPSAFREALKKTDFVGVTGKISFNKNGSLNSGTSTLFVVKGGKWVPMVTRKSEN